jgi:hypothetical protein
VITSLFDGAPRNAGSASWIVGGASTMDWTTRELDLAVAAAEVYRSDPPFALPTGCGRAGPGPADPCWTAMTTAQVDQLTDPLQHLLDAAAADRPDSTCERYLKGTRPVPRNAHGGIRTAVRTLWHTEHLGGWPTSQLLALARHWFGQPFREDKLAAMLLLAEHLAGRFTLADGDALARPLGEGSWPTGAAATDMPQGPARLPHRSPAPEQAAAPRGRGAGHVDDRGEAHASRDGADPAAPPGTGRRWQERLDTAHSSLGASSPTTAVMARDHPIPPGRRETTSIDPFTLG